MFSEIYRASDVELKNSFGVMYPEAFTQPTAEYHALTSTTAMIDLCHWGALQLIGEDRVRLLNSLTTNDAASLKTGEACHSALTTIKGKLIAELVILRRENDLLLLVTQGDKRAVADAIKKHIISDDVEVLDWSNETGIFALEGPKSREVLWRLFPNDPIPKEHLQFINTEYLGTPVTIVRNSVSGEDGFHLIVLSLEIVFIRKYIIQSGRADDMALAGRIAWNTRRVEAGLPGWGSDVTPEENFPKECRLDSVVSYDKGCFLGQETLARMHHRGHPNWLLVGLTPRDDTPDFDTDADVSAMLPAETPLFAPADLDKQVGRITSAVFSPKLEKPLALGYVRATLAEPGTELTLHTDAHTTTLIVTLLPIT